MTLQEFIKQTTKIENEYMNVRNRLICNDGFNMSVQGSRGHYCTPRTNTDSYQSLEIGFPSEEEPLIYQYAEDKERLTDTVYGYVPVEIIQEVINKHGGIDFEKTFKNE